MTRCAPGFADRDGARGVKLRLRHASHSSYLCRQLRRRGQVPHVIGAGIRPSDSPQTRASIEARRRLTLKAGGATDDRNVFDVMAPTVFGQASERRHEENCGILWRASLRASRVGGEGVLSLSSRHPTCRMGQRAFAGARLARRLALREMSDPGRRRRLSSRYSPMRARHRARHRSRTSAGDGGASGS